MRIKSNAFFLCGFSSSKSLTLTRDTAYSSEMPVAVCQSLQYHIPQNFYLHRENDSSASDNDNEHRNIQEITWGVPTALAAVVRGAFKF
jgi:hypothetical protein